MDPVTIIALALAPSVAVLGIGCALATYRTVRDVIPRRRRLVLGSFPRR